MSFKSEFDPVAPAIEVFADQFGGLIPDTVSNVQEALKAINDIDLSITFDDFLEGKTTDDLTEGALNKYFTNARAQSALESHTEDDTIHFLEGEINHENILNIGTYSHSQIDSHIDNTSNPHSVTKTQVGLGNVGDFLQASKTEFDELLSDFGDLLSDFDNHVADTTIHFTQAQISITESQISDLQNYILASEKGQSLGVATLDASGRIPSSQLTLTATEYKGTWNANTNTPTLIDGTGTQGDFYITSTEGSQDLGSGSIDFNLGDYVFYNGTTWEKSTNSNLLQSVNGYTGVVNLTTADIAEVTNLYFTNTRAVTALTGQDISLFNNDSGYITGVDWGDIVGDLADQLDLQAALDDKADSSDLHSPVTLSGTPDYLSLLGQQITRNLINLTSHITGTLPVANGGTNKTSFNSNQILYGSLSQSGNFSFDGETLGIFGGNGGDLKFLIDTDAWQSVHNIFEIRDDGVLALSVQVINSAGVDLKLFNGGRFVGSGSQLTSLNANNISSGILAIARGGTAKNSFNANQLHYGDFLQSSKLSFDGNFLTISDSGADTLWVQNDSANVNNNAIRVHAQGSIRAAIRANGRIWTNERIGIGVTAPTRQLCFTDTGLGFERVGVNTLGFFTGNTERMRLDANGMLGIGASPVSSTFVRINPGTTFYGIYTEGNPTRGLHINTASDYGLYIAGGSRNYMNGGLAIAKATLNTGTTLDVNGVIQGQGYRSADNSNGITTTVAASQSFIVKNGLVTAVVGAECPRVDAWIDGEWVEVGRAIYKLGGIENKGQWNFALQKPAQRFRLVEDEPEISFIDWIKGDGEIGLENIKTSPATFFGATDGSIHEFEFSKPVVLIETFGYYIYSE